MIVIINAAILIISITQSDVFFVDSISSNSFPKTIANLNAIVSHIQNPQLYSPQWANKIKIQETNVVIATFGIEKGDLITLYPIEHISIGKENLRCKDDNHIVSKRVDLLQEERYPYPYLRMAPQPLYIHLERNKIYGEGWNGNMIPTVSDSTDHEIQSNCMFVPLPSAAPLCGIVATRYIEKGEIIISDNLEDNKEKKRLYKFTEKIANKYAFELGDLTQYLAMAYTHIQKPCKSEEVAKRQIYHKINEYYPNIKQIHFNPDVFTVADFLSQDECERLICKARNNIQPCLVKNEETGAVEPDLSRTSTNANIPMREVPTITKKLLDLANCSKDQMEILQVLNYKRGQQFQAHTDGFDGATSACGFLDSGRIVTIFCYLNDVEEGGSTLFTKLPLNIKPIRGMAVVHFPMSLDLVEDEKTAHTGMIAQDEKWLLTTFFWKHEKGDFRYSEENVQGLSEDLI